MLRGWEFDSEKWVLSLTTTLKHRAVHRWARIFDPQTHVYPDTEAYTEREEEEEVDSLFIYEPLKRLLPSNLVIDINMSVASRTRSSRNRRGSNCVLSCRCTFTCQWFLVLLRCTPTLYLTLLPPYPVWVSRSTVVDGLGRKQDTDGRFKIRWAK